MPELNEVPKIINSTLRDIPARLRELADKIERKDPYLDVDTCAIVLVADDRIHVFGYGDRSEHDTIGITLLAGANLTADNYR